jgi:NADPH2:quinone reductase
MSAPASSIFAPGDRVAFADGPHANAELVAVDADRLIPLPDHISHETAASLLLQGLTAQYLLRDSHRVQAGESVLIHAAAGGVGQLLVQLAVAAGARVLALASTVEKCAAALAAGAHLATTYDDDWVDVARVFATGGVDVAYDSVGSTLHDSLRAVRTGGQVVFYGMAGGDPEPVDPRLLMDESKSLTGGDLWNVLRTPDDRRSRSRELFDAVRGGALDVHIAARYPLAQGAAAHAFLESRGAIGKVLLIP